MCISYISVQQPAMNSEFTWQLSKWLNVDIKWTYSYLKLYVYMDKHVLKNVTENINKITKTTNLLMAFIFILSSYLFHVLWHVHVLLRVFPWMCFSVHHIYFWQQAANIHPLASPCLQAVEYCPFDFLELWFW